MKRLFHTATDDEIKLGKISDVYFVRAAQILDHKNLHKRVKAEIRAASLPDGWNWAVISGIEETLHLLEGLEVDVWSMKEGTIFEAEEPVLVIEGDYLKWAVFETALLGLICQASGVATKAARCKKAAGDRVVVSFGARRMHPALAPMIERSAFLGGCDGVAVVASAELIGEEPSGTMPHALILTIGDDAETYRLFDQIMPEGVKRVALIDTFSDEKFGALRAAEALGEHLFAVRLDTPSSRRGDFVKIMREVRWELDLRGYNHVNIFLSGGLNEEKIAEYNVYADAYGVGTSISNAPVVDFSLDIVEVEGKPFAKRGKMSGFKQTYVCDNCGKRMIVPFDLVIERCDCGGSVNALIHKEIEGGKIMTELPGPQEIRRKVLDQLVRFEL